MDDIQEALNRVEANEQGISRELENLSRLVIKSALGSDSEVAAARSLARVFELILMAPADCNFLTVVEKTVASLAETAAPHEHYARDGVAYWLASSDKKNPFAAANMAKISRGWVLTA